jgi:hypothetical protein
MQCLPEGINMDETLEIALKRPRGEIKTATVDIQEIPEGTLGWNYRAWINLAGQTVEFMQATKGDRDIRDYFPFEGHDTYRDEGVISHRSPINSLEDWVAWIKEYVSDLDPRDISRARREEGL